MRQPIGAKFCMLISTRPNFMYAGPKFWRAIRKKNFKRQKHANFGPISINFKVRRQISPERMKILKIG